MDEVTLRRKPDGMAKLCALLREIIRALQGGK